jgi:hypothetical protein
MHGFFIATVRGAEHLKPALARHLVDARRLASRSAGRDSRGRASETSRWSGRVAMAALGAAVALLAVSMPAAGASAGQLETVTIATAPFEPTALAFYASARGLFRKYRIDAKLVVTADPGAGVAAMLAGDAQFASTHAEVLRCFGRRECR